MAYTEESQEIPIDGMAEKLDRIKRFDGPPAEFRPAFLEWSSQSGLVYRVQVADDPNVAWADDPGATAIPATNATTSWSGPAPAGGSNAVYRVIVSP